ncbi:hypothetical protein NEUTE1DRAFT_90505 [Neurospora tetrasperma FGSC 2508]|uniref:WLM domain-containing protein n=1 Tax=Neurospora tetrasperma (strain FGSC 2508 / ATCC MYA-4615 / P0657) TaxID=510951 RepID=F8N1K3_NEUT8|nr:uncharacterized protein NEUTE1DRAFT_90505 [Neurospora tetrasperma FGSC 2508]EGO52334.1 hypothetical protein NEUTE1DRAFT_90505 [Neurospora tetrasperma FGSC 2508]
MPLGIQRLNAKKSHPNDRIIFIKPLKGPDEAIAQDFLERIAAQCQYEPNREFVGRNFNAGEVIQLVLKSLSGHWLPFNYVQMVMMHELAHCKQMNHSRAFWAVRNNYADEMRLLWGRGYTGEGLWGRGALLSTGEWERNTVQPGEGLPEHLCGGTYRSRGRKRKAKAPKPKLSYKEQKERRILKKFGANGVKLGEDEKVKKELEGGKKVVAKPRVAGSARGRELRAAAALARFEGLKKEKEEEEKVKQEEIDEDETGSGTESDEYEDEDDQDGVVAVDINGKKLLDGKGRGMIKVCEDENPEDQDAQQELRELMDFNDGARNSTPKLSAVKVEPSSTHTGIPENVIQAPVSSHKNRKENLGEDASQKVSQIRSTVQSMNKNHHASTTTEKPPGVKTDPTRPPQKKENISPSSIPKSTSEAEPSSRTCPICSFANEPTCITCTICANVLDPKNVVGSWVCTSQTCQGSQYRNAGDCGICGVCGERKQRGTG